ncbi:MULTISPECIES: HigA family addiction module antitoxin [Buttiauxella]|jgi:addiction module HigA family antidote|uniref:HigA family protein n=1 Tax=Buttiauxella ferragutiae ATCC 51602 TaxID=1354252 RepID=A0ABX2W2B2_9ENTR|nr:MULTISPECIES: HigA family addiction module antitoxin [Buttiauxella]AYN27243.1 addiction module antidote protein, HigA family [Buttiauxella sp. 3AFRM03]MCE0825095.1 HigA family addiction module antitoxin [Buttiauxella ferragutiae]OAT24645.1 HigA family protein [Buttiauxella ferragutiae ATCC 51602]TDN51803.1 addiction module HigA family antidote [Buttiauxella sp. JUb87]UNK60342.1 HigA family addiction module antitoxin [Buttiauxella ferragutiae]
MVQAQRKPTTVGDVLLYEYLEPTGLRINDLAEMLQVHRNTVSKLLNNNSKLTTDMAFRLAKAFDTSVDFWLNLQTNLDVWEIQNDPRTQVEISRIITLKEMLERKTRAA